MAKLSVLMSVWNAAPFLRESVESILEQSFENFEFILVNDGSSDESAEILASYHDPRMQIISLDQNVGMARALNRGLQHISTPYIARMDADDWSYPDRLERQYAFMERHPEVSICGTWAESYEGSELYAQGYYGVGHEEICQHLLFRKALFCHPSVMMRKSVVDQTKGYNPDYSHAADMALWYDALPLGKMANLPEILIKYRRHPKQISQMEEGLSQEWARQIFENWLELQMPDLPQKLRKLHTQLVYKQFPKRYEKLRDVREWALRLDTWNQETHFIPARALREELAKHWFYACNSIRPLNKNVWRMHRSFPFRQDFPVGWSNSWKFWWNCMKRNESTYVTSYEA